jgi:hypothetical protein
LQQILDAKNWFCMPLQPSDQKTWISWCHHHHHHHWLYSLLQALTAPTMLFHWLRSCALFLHPWIPRTRNSWCQSHRLLQCVEVKQSRYTPWRRLRERKYSFYSFLTSALDRVSGLRQAPAALYPRGKDPGYPLDRRLGGPQSQFRHRG